ncbi:DNA polymerase [Babesia duncani]|uniref:DNA polymerase n=1 Tax=Babesia duncani TaxID=323732 RepID=A0AAD9UQE2_9APIC|nr:DNA polymerase [Babesia duncani]
MDLQAKYKLSRANVTLKVSIRAPDAPEEPAKYMGCGVCIHVSTSKQTSLEQHTVLGIITQLFKTLQELHKFPLAEVRGLALTFSLLYPPQNTSILEHVTAASHAHETPKRSRDQSISHQSQEKMDRDPQELHAQTPTRDTLPSPAPSTPLGARTKRTRRSTHASFKRTFKSKIPINARNKSPNCQSNAQESILPYLTPTRPVAKESKRLVITDALLGALIRCTWPSRLLVARSLHALETWSRNCASTLTPNQLYTRRLAQWCHLLSKLDKRDLLQMLHAATQDYIVHFNTTPSPARLQ